MNYSERHPAGITFSILASTFVCLSCARDPVAADETTSGPGSTSIASTGEVVDTGSSSTTESEPNPDLPPDPDTGEETPSCAATGDCPQIDLLFVIDNSASMGQEQLHLARSFESLVEQLRDLRDVDGDRLDPDVNIIVTTTDMGHPLCSPFKPFGYTPSRGAPIQTGCNDRINLFFGLDPAIPESAEEACTENCPTDVLPGDHFIHFDSQGSNTLDDDVAAALACIAPQGISGCGFESPLETMLQAINEDACWNDPEQPSCDDQPQWADVTEGFLRDDAVLAIVVLTDELDCSVAAPEGYSFFTDVDNPVYWNIDPQLGVPRTSSAICFNAGVTCIDDDGDGLYEDCGSQDTGALLPVERYISYFDWLEQQGKEVVMLGLLGVPEVVAHSPEPPYEPIAGGAVDLLYRGEWVDMPYPAGDIVPRDWDYGIRAADNVFRFGDLAPGCFGSDDSGDVTGHALPPVRIREVCESLDGETPQGDVATRCCIESVCGSDYAASYECLTGMMATAIGRLR